VSGQDLLFAALPLLVLIALVAGFTITTRLRRPRAPRRVLVEPGGAVPSRPVPPRSEPEDPWWANPWLWIGVAGVSVVLGIFVWPGFFGGAVLVVPLVIVSRPRREPEMDPRSNGHARRDGDRMG
jgi:hypothetical protein